MASGKEPRQTTSNIGLMQRPSLQAIHHGLNKYYYSMVINCRKSEAEQRMLNNLNKVDWSNSLKQEDYEKQNNSNVECMKVFKKLTGDYIKWIEEEN